VTLEDDIVIAGRIAQTLPVILALVKAIEVLVSTDSDSKAQLAAMETAAEAMKLRMDQLKFPAEAAI
jgi:hypothetical protein